MQFYLTFANETGWLGCCYVEADDFLHAVEEAHRLGCNPGGGVAGCEVPEREYYVEEQHLGQLLSQGDLERITGVPAVVSTLAEAELAEEVFTLGFDE